jgi:hypothetical protein
MPEIPQDNCEPCKECYGIVLKGIVANPYIAGVFMGIPSYVALSGLNWMGSVFSYVSMSGGAMYSYYTLLGITLGFWLLELASIYYMLPNVLAFCAFCHSAVGSWWLVNFVIMMCIGWHYVPIMLIFYAFIAILSPAIIWHLTGDIIRAYKDKMLEDIAVLNASASSRASASGAYNSFNDVEAGAGSGSGSAK